MRTPVDALATHQASVEIAASADVIYGMLSDITRMGEWSPESTGGEWLRGGSGAVGDWFVGSNQAGERTWDRECEVAVAEPGREFTFVVGGVEANCTWWSYELESAADGAGSADGGTTLVTERWWMVNKTPAMAAATPEQLAERVAYTEEMLHATLARLKQAAEAG